MKRTFSVLMLAFLSLVLAKAASAATWYVRADGGTRYSANASTGQCDGLADAAYSGQGVNQHCAFNDYRFLWDDQHTYGQFPWVIAGGDTVILDNTKQWRVGFDQTGPNDPWCWGGGGPFSCYNPTIPAGTASQHTRILGRNYASCSTAAGQPDTTKMTQIFGGHGVNNALNLSGAQFVDVQCVEVTRHSSCMVHGLPVYGSYCSNGYPLDDYDSEGVGIDDNAHDVLMQDMYIHGHVDSGIRGNIGGQVTANRVRIAFNGMSGWNFDDGTNASKGILKLSYVSVIGNGCIEEYPAVDPFPALVCYDQQSSGYGDGIGTQAGYGISVAIDHTVFAYNTQDGLDLGHVDSNTNTLSITDSEAYGNMGGQFKWGANFQTATFNNNLTLANCGRMSAPLPGAPSTYNKYLTEFCRAFDGLSFNFRQGGTLQMANNTIVSYAPTTLDVECWDASCSNSAWNFSNNVVLGYDNPNTYSYGGQQGGPGLFYLPQTIGTINRVDNIYRGIRGSCQAGVQQASNGGTIVGESCSDPQFVNEPAGFASESTLDTFDFALSSTSPARDVAPLASGLTADFYGNTRSVPTSLGGVEYGSTPGFTNVSYISSAPLQIPTAPAPVAVAAPTPIAPAPSNPSSNLIPTHTAIAVTKASASSPDVVTITVVPASGSKVASGKVGIYANNQLVYTFELNEKGKVKFNLNAHKVTPPFYAVYVGSTTMATSTSNVITAALVAGLH